MKQQSKKRGRPINRYTISMNWLKGKDPYIDKIIEKYDNGEIHYEVGKTLIEEYVNKNLNGILI